MKKPIEGLKVRFQSQDLPDHRNAAKVFLNPDLLLESGLSDGRLCIIEAPETTGNRREAVAWCATEKTIGRKVAMVSRALLEVAPFSLQDQLRITDAGSVPNAEAVILRDVTPNVPPVNPEEQSHWEYFLKGRFEIAEYVFPKLAFKNLSLLGPKRSFIVEYVNGSTSNVAKYSPSTKAHICDANAETNGASRELRVPGIPGMGSAQLKRLNLFFRGFEVDFGPYSSPAFSCGMIIQGSRGTGKSMLLNQIATTQWGEIIRIRGSDKPAAIQEHFTNVMARQRPTIMLIDDIGRLTGKDRPYRQASSEAFEEGLLRLAAKAEERRRRPNVVVIATCNDYLEDIPDFLQADCLFDQYIRLSVPDAPARKEILRSFKPNFAPELLEQYISAIGDRTHAYTGSDLRKLDRRACLALVERSNYSTDEPVTWEDFKKALKEVRPTAMHDITLKPPTVHWNDIGGYGEVKNALQRVLRRPAADQKQLWKPPKGVLLYGPPGCSKTMTAQAMATESGYNFFAVKGGELLNMYVGETERSIRRLFQRAREASPSIIFFDEIDSLAGSRSSPGGATSSGGVQALTTLLTEMDGFEQLGNVFVLAATNKPDMLDPAMLRPGRFDELIYVPLPDEKAREAILSNKAKELRFEVDAAELAKKTLGYSGAEIAQICNGAFSGWMGSSENETDDMRVLETAISRAPKRVTGEILGHFDKWRESIR